MTENEKRKLNHRSSQAVAIEDWGNVYDMLREDTAQASPSAELALALQTVQSDQCHEAPSIVED